MKKIFILLVVFATLFLLGCTDQNASNNSTNSNENIDVEPLTKFTFQEIDNEICEIDGKPIIRLFSTTWCPHCKWINSTYNDTMKEYIEQGKIVAYHWEYDIDDDSLRPGINKLSLEEKQIFENFSPKGSVPTYVFGCKYYRIGNGYEPVGNVSTEQNKARLAQEEQEFRAIIDKLIEEMN